MLSSATHNEYVIESFVVAFKDLRPDLLNGLQNIQNQQNQQNQIPLDEKSLIDTAGQIFSEKGNFRNALLTFAKNNDEIVKREKAYIDEQIKNVLESKVYLPKKGNVSRYYRELTHRNKLGVYVSIEIHRNITFDLIEKNKIISDKINWCVSGDHLQEIFRFLPKIRQPSGILVPPTRGTKHSRWYPLNNETVSEMKQISLELRLLQQYVLSSNQRVESRVMHDVGNDTNISSGTLDLDIKVDYTILDILQEKTGIDLKSFAEKFIRDRGNPQKQSEGKYNFNKNSTSSLVLNEIFEIVQIPNIFPKHIWLDPSLSNKEQFRSDIKAMKDSDCQVALMSINRHTVFWVKHNQTKTWILCDPWKQNFKPGPKHEQFCRDTFNEIIGSGIISNSYINALISGDKSPQMVQSNNDPDNWTFLARKCKDQLADEGSCSVAALSRVLQTSVTLTLVDNEPTYDELTELLNVPLKDWSAMLSSSLIRLGMFSMNRTKYIKSNK